MAENFFHTTRIFKLSFVFSDFTTPNQTLKYMYTFAFLNCKHFDFNGNLMFNDPFLDVATSL